MFCGDHGNTRKCQECIEVSTRLKKLHESESTSEFDRNRIRLSVNSRPAGRVKRGSSMALNDFSEGPYSV